MPGPYRAAATGCPGGLALAGWPVGAAYMPPGTFAAAETLRAAYMRPLQTVPKNGVYGWFVGEAFMPPGNPAPPQTPREGDIPPLRIARKRLPAWRGVGDAAPYGGLPANGCLPPHPGHAPLRRAAFLFVPPGTNSTIFIIYYFLFIICTIRGMIYLTPLSITKRSDPF